MFDECIQVALRIDNRDRNVQIPLRSLTLSLQWSAAPTPGVTPTPISKWFTPPADAAVVRRGPLLYALHPKEEFKQVKDYYHTLPVRRNAVDWEISTKEPWAYSLAIAGGAMAGEAGAAGVASADGMVEGGAGVERGRAEGGRAADGLAPAAVAARTLMTFDATPSKGWSILRPFDSEEYPFSILATARQLPEESWGYWAGSKITAQPPPSPVNATGPSVKIRLVPFGGTNIRISVMPWHVAV